MNKTTKHVDLLDEDKAIAGQNFVCLSFVFSLSITLIGYGINIY